MQPVKLTIPGAYWDTQLYSGRLYLFGRDNTILTLNWDQLIENLPVSDNVRLAATCAFQRSDFLYGNQWSLLFKDDEVRGLVTRKFDRLSKSKLIVDSHAIKTNSIERQDNPFPFPHADCTIYKKRIYIVGTSGLYSASCDKKARHAVSTRITKAWDCPSHTLAASYNRVALAAGAEGLYEYTIQYWEEFENSPEGRKNPSLISPQQCSLCGWAFYSIFGSSPEGDGFLAAFRKNTEEIEESDQWPRREFDRVVPGHEIFGERGISWATQDKLCQAVRQTVHVVKYAPWFKGKSDKKEFADLGTIKMPRKNGDIISGGVAMFGTVVECENTLVVLLSDGGNHVIPGEPINWRVYSRSKHYENQLHAIYEDRIEIWSFNQDYFVDQKIKRSGVSYTGWWPNVK